jgi:hypothetical protein
MFFPQSERPGFTPIQHKWHNYSFVYLNLVVVVSWYFSLCVCVNLTTLVQFLRLVTVSVITPKFRTVAMFILVDL